MPNETDVPLINTEHEINVENSHQGAFRLGELDYEALNYALAVDSLYAGVYRKNLVVTCLDQRPGFNCDYRKLTTTFNGVLESRSPFANLLRHNTR